MYVNKTYATHVLADPGCSQTLVSKVVCRRWRQEGGESANRQRDDPEVPWVGQEQAPPVIVEVLDGYWDLMYA